MVYANDQWVQLPTRDLYDSQMMSMAINVAKDMYEKGQKQLEDFSTKYGDFMTPILKDQDWYDKNVTGAARDLINSIYANGGDPLRDAASRAAISRFIYSLPTGNISKVKQSAENAKIYLQNLGKLKAAGKYNEDFAKFLGEDLNGWDTINGGDIWTLTSPTEMQTLKEATEPWYNNRTPHDLDKAGVESFGMQYNPNYQYTGFTRQDLLDIAAGRTPGWYGTPYADYYREKAKQKLEATGQPFTEADVERQLQEDVAQANEEYLVAPTRTADKFALEKYSTDQQIRAAAAKEKIAFEYDKKRANELGGGNGKNSTVDFIFNESRKKPGVDVPFSLEGEQLYQRIIPTASSARSIKNAKGQYGYSISSNDLNKISLAKERTRSGNRIGINGWEAGMGGYGYGELHFVPNGRMYTEYDSDGTPHSYITGELWNNNTPVIKDGKNQFEMEVYESGGVYPTVHGEHSKKSKLYEPRQ